MCPVCSVSLPYSIFLSKVIIEAASGYNWPGNPTETDIRTGIYIFKGDFYGLRMGHWHWHCLFLLYLSFWANYSVWQFNQFKPKFNEATSNSNTQQLWCILTIINTVWLLFQARCCKVFQCKTTQQHQQLTKIIILDKTAFYVSWRYDVHYSSQLIFTRDGIRTEPEPNEPN